jgi:ABC-2 type transport system ATP-binding protein
MSAISVQNLNFSYGNKTALNDVSFDVDAGTFCALLGPNGAGKSTLFSVLTGLLLPPSGGVSLATHSMSKHPRRALASTGVVFQQPSLDLDVSVAANMQYFAALQGLTKRTAAPRIQEALEKLSMFERRDEKVRKLNGGHRRRMEIARALIHRPKVLLLDEPTVGLDSATRHAITNHVHELAANGMAVLWATHLVDEIDDNDKVVLLHQSQIIADGPAKDLRGSQSLDTWFQNATGAT